MPHKFLSAIVASAVFGGTVGAMATAAVQSEANPAAIAAAVQRVQDTSAERSLNSIKAKLGQLYSIDAQLGQMVSGIQGIASSIKVASVAQGIDDSKLWMQLYGGCLNTAALASTYAPTRCPFNPPMGR